MSKMECKKYRPEGEKVWSIIFEHPLRLNSKGEYGRWTRRTLDTTDSNTADVRVNEMKEILSNKEYWSIKNKKLNEKRYSKVIISAFYDSILHYNNLDIRENLLPLPSEYDGYKKILFMGTTGAGKTTLLRHLIGTSKEKFPLTSTAKATVSDLEVIVSEGNYRCVVNFFPEPLIRSFVEECTYDAVVKAEKTKDENKICESFFENKEQTFRLNHIIGNLDSKKDEKQSFHFPGEDEQSSSESTISKTDNTNLINNVKNYIDRIVLISEQSKKQYTESNSNDQKEYDAEKFQEIVIKKPEFKLLINDIMNDIKSRFEDVKEGFLYSDENSWPLYWEYENKDKSSFLNSLKLFSSNHYTLFGRLLSPLVEGMRIQGPFYPAFLSGSSQKLVFIDGQGLGHTAESAGSQSIPKKLENMFGDVDTILLVDNAEQPMQHAPLTAMKRVIVSGYVDQLMVSFTHFDAVEGDNFETEYDKKIHVYRSLVNGLYTLEKDIGKAMIQRLEEDLISRCVYLGLLHKNETSIDDNTKKQLDYLLGNTRSKSKVQNVTVAKPNYEAEKLSQVMHEAVENFRMRWDLRFNGGFTRKYNSPYDMSLVHKEHWTRIKALNRRIVEFNSIEYDYLRPVNDLKSLVTEQISTYLDEPLRWTPNEPNEETMFEFTNSVRRVISTTLGMYIEEKMIDQRKDQWQRAYEFKGSGSTKLRSNEIESVYDRIAPLVKSNDHWKSLSNDVYSMLENSISSVHESMKDKPSENIIKPSNFVFES